MSSAQGWRQTHRWVVIVVLVGLVVVGLVTYRWAQRNEEADRKAEQLMTELADAGLRVPASHDTIANTLGDDGGAVCANPSSALRKAIVDTALVNGAASVGQRGIIGEVDLVTGTVIVLEVYCPDQVDAFQDMVAGYELDSVSNSSGEG